MKPRPRIRKTIKWGGSIVTVLLTLLVVASFVAPQHWQQSPQETFGFERGYFAIEWMQQTYGIHRTWSSPFIRAMRFTFYDGPRGSWFTVPFGGPALLSLCVTATAWWLDSHSLRVKPLHPCPKCNYDRTGLAIGAACPECGATPMNT